MRLVRSSSMEGELSITKTKSNFFGDAQGYLIYFGRFRLRCGRGQALLVASASRHGDQARGAESGTTGKLRPKRGWGGRGRGWHVCHGLQSFLDSRRSA